MKANNMFKTVGKRGASVLLFGEDREKDSAAVQSLDGQKTADAIFVALMPSL